MSNSIPGPDKRIPGRPDSGRRQALRTALVGAGVLGFGLAGTARLAAAANRSGPIRILHIMSYHSAWQWNIDQFEAFRDVLSDLDIEYQVLELDMKRNSDPAWQEEVSAEAVAMIESWQPDLVYTNDDYAQEHVVQHRPDTGIPYVFSAVNADPARYGFDRRQDVTGVLEQEHYLETIRLLREIAPDVRRIAVLMDVDPTWTGVMARMKDAYSDLPDLEVVGWDTLPTFDAYRRKVDRYQTDADALAVLGVFNLKDEHGRDIPFEEVLRWTAENSALPDFSYWTSRVELGTLASVSVSGREQGRVAGEMARAILVDGRSPGSIPMSPTLRGEPVVSLARARTLGLQIPSSTLLKAQVLTTFAWDG